jgi:hypothetical protein
MPMLQFTDRGNVIGRRILNRGKLTERTILSIKVVSTLRALRFLSMDLDSGPASNNIVWVSSPILVVIRNARPWAPIARIRWAQSVVHEIPKHTTTTVYRRISLDKSHVEIRMITGKEKGLTNFPDRRMVDL